MGIVDRAEVFVPPKPRVDLMRFADRAQTTVQMLFDGTVRAERLMMRKEKALLGRRCVAFLRDPSGLLPIELADIALVVPRIKRGIETEYLPVVIFEQDCVSSSPCSSSSRTSFSNISPGTKFAGQVSVDRSQFSVRNARVAMLRRCLV
ncbi:MAG: hypothetical protein ABSG23_00625 [Terriglobales bacterium]